VINCRRESVLITVSIGLGVPDSASPPSQERSSHGGREQTKIPHGEQNQAKPMATQGGGVPKGDTHILTAHTWHKAGRTPQGGVRLWGVRERPEGVASTPYMISSAGVGQVTPSGLRTGTNISPRRLRLPADDRANRHGIEYKVPIAQSLTGRKGGALCLLRDTHVRHLQVDLLALEEVDEALGIAWHERRRRFP
jgi:hypothetical protein